MSDVKQLSDKLNEVIADFEEAFFNYVSAANAAAIDYRRSQTAARGYSVEAPDELKLAPAYATTAVERAMGRAMERARALAT